MAKMQLKHLATARVRGLSRGLFGTVVFLTSCADYNFTAREASQEEGRTEIETFQYRATEIVPNVDFLFMIDDSCSMDSIINQLNSGFESLDQATYPSGTRMAASYMSPAKVLANGNFDPQTAWLNTSEAPEVAASPGFLELVSGPRIANFLSSFPEYVNQFPKQGCSAWFGAGEKNAKGESCLRAATQTPSICTQAEPGLTVLMQLLRKATARSEKLFRSGSVVNIVMVSDTHDPGVSTFYGSSGAEAKAPDLQQVQAAVFGNSPDIRTLRLSGIVPLPAAGHPILTGLKVVGDLPANGDSKLSGEEVHDYAYVPYIKATQGVGMWAGNGDWRASAEELVQTTSTWEAGTFRLKYHADAIQQILFDDVPLKNDEYRVLDGGHTIQITKDVSNPGDPHQVVVKYWFAN